MDLPSAPKWCSLQKTISLSNITLVGQRNTSYEGKDCVAFQLSKVTNNITSNFSSFMTMRNCSARQMIACRVQKNLLSGILNLQYYFRVQQRLNLVSGQRVQEFAKRMYGIHGVKIFFYIVHISGVSVRRRRKA